MRVALAPLLLLPLGQDPGTTDSQEASEEGTYLQAAHDTARWLQLIGFRAKHGRSWPTQIEGERTTSLALYDGAPGVVLFFLETYYQTGDEAFLKEALAGADEILARVDEMGATLPDGLYTGIAGVGFMLTEAWKASGEKRYRKGAKRCFQQVAERALEHAGGVRWNESTDVIYGSAGIGLYLLYVQRELGEDSALELARAAGDALIAQGIASDGGLKWRMTPDFARLMPNFSHGTAGIGHFLISLYLVTGEQRYREAATAAGKYLRGIASPQKDGGTLVFHSEPGNEDLFYLSWCHGPAGTIRFLRTLGYATRDPVWARFTDELVAGVEGTGIPELRTRGYWNNVGACCGDAGVADAMLGLYRIDASPERMDFARRLLANVLARSRSDDFGRRWRHAEHRVRPRELATQTGLMQGAAGIGLVFLRAHAVESGGAPRIVLPDDPWPTLERERGEAETTR